MSEWDDIIAETHRQNLRRMQEEEQKKQLEREPVEITMLVGIFNLIGKLIKFLFSCLTLVFVALFFIIKYCFIFLVFLRNKFFIHWNWYVKIENAVHKVLLWIKKAIEIFLGLLFFAILFFPLIILFKYFDLWLVVGAAFLYYHYGK